MSTENMADALIGRTFNGYRVTRYIARGGMGLVFEGVQESLGRNVALKFLYPHLSSDNHFRERFEREARAVAQLNHPNIVRVLDYGFEGSYYYIVLDYIDGSSLRDHLASLDAEGLTLRSDRMMSILQQVAGALNYAHGLGYVHRDVKPGNILLSRDGRVVLTDFGVVKLMGTDQFTVTGAFVGTPEYMSPEQATSTDIGPASDVYALAIVAYEMLVGRVPFKAQTPIHVMQMQMSEPPPPPSAIVPSIPFEIDAIFRRALAKHPGERYPTPVAFVEDLTRAIAANPVTTGGGIPTLINDPSTANRPGYPSPASYPTGGQTPQAAPNYPSMQASQPGYQSQPTVLQSGVHPPADASQSYPQSTGGTMPPVPPTTGYAVAADSNPPGRRNSAVIVGVVLLLLLAAGVAGFFLLAGDDDDGDDDSNVGAAATATAAAAESTQAGDPTATEPAGAETPETAPEATPTGDGQVVNVEPTATSTETATDTPEPSATAEPLPPMVIYYAHKPEDEHNPQIYVMNLDGSGSRLFAEARGHTWGPVTSRDGTRMIFSSVTREDHTVHTADGGGLIGSGNHDIYTVDIVGTDFDSLQSQNVDNASDEFTSWDNGWSWSIDNEWITFTSDRPTEDGSTDWEIYVMRADGSEIIQLTDTPYNEGWPVWTPDGNHIIYSSDETGNDEIYIMNADGTNPQQLTDRPTSNNLFPSVSPDGTRIVFSSQIPDGGEGNIWIMNIDGSEPRQLTSTVALNNIPSFCPAGDLIVFVSDIRGNDNVYIMNADGTGLVQLTDDPGEDTTPHCSLIPTGTQ